jgi:Putative stress-responsive transcriptional regulator
MNKVIQANLAGQPFTFDDDAYEALDDYLHRVSQHFSRKSGQAEIMQDIEARLAELLHQQTKGRQIVTLQDIDAAILTLGQPEDFASEEEEESYSSAGSSSSYNYGPRQQGSARYGRRLMRDQETKMVAGVCAGLTAYFGIPEPIWLRLTFALGTIFTGGAFLIAYIVLWIVMPEARTASDRLAMRGEPIDLESIGRQVEREVNDFGHRINDWSNDFQRNNKGRGCKNHFRGKRGSSWSTTPPRNAEEERQRARDAGFMV